MCEYVWSLPKQSAANCIIGYAKASKFSTKGPWRLWDGLDEMMRGGAIHIKHRKRGLKGKRYVRATGMGRGAREKPGKERVCCERMTSRMG